jgi:glycosyltransferase involved in cell wall biosynthesis
MNISIIICTYNRAHLLKNAIRSLFDMEIPEGCDVELVVVNNASTDNTKSVIDNFLKNENFRVKVLFEPKLGKSFALNTAINNASGDILALVDDDHIASQGYLKTIYKAIKEYPSYNIFCGRILPNWDGTEPDWVHDNKVYPIRPFPVPYFDLGSKDIDVTLSSFLPGAGNLVLYRRLFEQIGNFSIELGPVGHNLRGGEDTDFVLRALEKGERILFIPEMIQYHFVDPVRLKLGYLLKNAYLRSMVARSLREKPGVKLLGSVPLYMIRKAAEHLFKSLLTFKSRRRRFFLVRFAATLGEIQGCRKEGNRFN